MTPAERRDITLDEFNWRMNKIMDNNPDKRNPVENGECVYTSKTDEHCIIAEYMRLYDPDLLPNRPGMTKPSATILFSQAGYDKMVAFRAGYYQTIADQIDYSTKENLTWKEVQENNDLRVQ